MPITPRLHLVGIVTADLARSLRFYRLLGLDLPDDADHQPHVEVQLPGLLLAWDPIETMRSFDPGAQVPSGPGRISLAFHCGTPAGVDETVAMLEQAGVEVHLAPFDAFWGQRYASVLDPDGNGVDLFAELP
jgi:catechol 2,3-dioxygenase-like lactoylglutathione lyase family enzyme